MKLPNNVYNVLKWIMLLGVPVGAFITSVIASINTGDPSAIITAVFTGLATLAGFVIKVSDSNYYGELNDNGGNK